MTVLEIEKPLTISDRLNLKALETIMRPDSGEKSKNCLDRKTTSRDREKPLMTVQAIGRMHWVELVAICTEVMRHQKALAFEGGRTGHQRMNHSNHSQGFLHDTKTQETRICRSPINRGEPALRTHRRGCCCDGPVRRWLFEQFYMHRNV